MLGFPRVKPFFLHSFENRKVVKFNGDERLIKANLTAANNWGLSTYSGVVCQKRNLDGR